MSSELNLLICFAALAVMGWCVYSLSTKGLGVAISPRLAMIGYIVACMVGAVTCGVLVVCQHVFRPEYAPRAWLEGISSAAFSASLFGMMWMSVVYVMNGIRRIRAALLDSRSSLPTSKSSATPHDSGDADNRHQRDGAE